MKTRGTYAIRVRPSYFKITNMQAEVAFWRSLLQVAPINFTTHWVEFVVGNTRIGFLLNDFGDKLEGCKQRAGTGSGRRHHGSCGSTGQSGGR